MSISPAVDERLKAPLPTAMRAFQPTRRGGELLEAGAAPRKRQRVDNASSAGSKWRKPTYIVRKEEKEELLETIEGLQRQVLELQQSKSAPTPDELSTGGAKRKQVEMSMLHRSSRSVSRAQSALSSYLERIPFEMTVCLGTDPIERRDALAALKPRKIHAALEYMSTRTRYLDPFQPFAEASRYLLDSGDYCAHHFDRIVLDASHVSVRRVYDALRHWVWHAEMLVTDELGDVTIRDENVYDDAGIQQSHFVSKLTTGVPLEVNIVHNFEFFERSDDHADGGPLGVLAEDFVDRDELSPYRASERVHQDVTTVCTVRLHSRKRLNPVTSQLEEQTAVVLTRASLLKLHKPRIVLSPGIEHDLRQGIAEWADVMLASVLEHAYSRHQESAPLSAW